MKRLISIFLLILIGCMVHSPAILADGEIKVAPLPKSLMESLNSGKEIMLFPPEKRRFDIDELIDSQTALDGKRRICSLKCDTFSVCDPECKLQKICWRECADFD